MKTRGPYLRARLKRIADDVQAGRPRTAKARMQGLHRSRIYAIRNIEMGHCMACGHDRPPELSMRCRLCQDKWAAGHKKWLGSPTV